jgi:tol-pal system protein YbgF
VRVVSAVALAGLALLAAGCGTNGLRLDGGRSQREEELARRVAELEQRATRLEVELERLRRQVPVPSEPARAPVSGAPAASAPSAAPAARSAAGESALPLGARRQGKIEVHDLADPGEPAASAAVPADIQQAYDAAYALFEAGHFAESEAAFSGLLSGASTGDLADNAWFWIGESRRARGDREGALASYRKVVEDFPQGNKVPDALFEIGQCLAEGGETGQAEEVFQELVRLYPTTAAAELARKRLEKP